MRFSVSRKVPASRKSAESSCDVFPLAAFSDWNFISSLGAYVFAAGMAVFFANMILAFVRKAPAPANPWGPGATHA
jgi:heme/copper-type cytochrome/quinol oxidase subunit 1